MFSLCCSLRFKPDTSRSDAASLRLRAAISDDSLAVEELEPEPDEGELEAADELLFADELDVEEDCIFALKCLRNLRTRSSSVVYITVNKYTLRTISSMVPA